MRLITFSLKHVLRSFVVPCFVESNVPEGAVFNSRTRFQLTVALLC